MTIRRSLPHREEPGLATRHELLATTDQQLENLTLRVDFSDRMSMIDFKTLPSGDF